MRNSLDPHKHCCASISHSMQSKQEKRLFLYINPLKQSRARKSGKSSSHLPTTRILNYGKSSAKQSKFVDLNVSPRIFSLNLDQIPAQGRLPSWAVFKFHSTGDAFGSETFRGNPKSEQVVSRIFFHDFKSTKPPASNSLMWQLIGPFFQLQRVFFMFTSLCCHGTVMTSLGGSMEIVGNGTLEVGAALADMRAS